MTEPQEPSAASAKGPRVSVLMPTYQGMEFLARVFDALSSQVVPFEWEMIVVDSSSSDGTWEYVGERQGTFPVPLKRERIFGVEFDHGDTRNMLAARSRGEFLVFLTQDAIPASDAWLATLIANFDDAAVGAVTCRNVPRPDAERLTKLFSEGDMGYWSERREVRLPEAAEYAAMGPHEKRQLFNFNDVASAFRRELWERHPFPRTPFGEDILMARAFLEAGYTVVYDSDACVEHSHDYGPEETQSRCRVDAEFNAEWLDRICIGSARDADTMTKRLSSQDAEAIDAMGLGSSEAGQLKAESVRLRRATFHGLYEGSHSRRRRPASRMLESAQLTLLYVVHGFPPETWAGTEIYTYNIAKEMMRRGHKVAILTRSPGQDGDPEFHLREEEFQGLHVFRMTHRLEHRSLEESYLKRGPEQAFRQVLDVVQPDVVHFQHLIHLSASLVDIAANRGHATVVTCHDYWGLCSRVQMIRPDGNICPSNMGSGCYLCVKERGLAHVERAARLDRAGGGVFESIAGFVAGAKAAPEGASHRAEEYAAVRARERIVPAAYARADLRISPSRFLRDTYLASGAFEPHTFLFSDNGMRTDHVAALEPAPDADGKVRFGFVGSLVWYKGGEVLIRAMARLGAAGLADKVHLNVYGGFDPENDEHHARLLELSQGAPVTFHGRFDNARLSEVYREIDVLVVPSVWYENSPITIHEAFLTETPVIASAIGGMAEFVRDGVDGLHFDVGSDEDLAAKMNQVATEPGLLGRLRSADWMRVKTIDEDGEVMEARYRSLATILRDAPGDDGPKWESPAEGATERSGPVESQGPGVVLMRPGAALGFEIGPGARGSLRLEVDLLFLAGETGLALGGEVQFSGGATVAIPDHLPGSGPLSGSGKWTGAEDRHETASFQVPPGAAPKTMLLRTGAGQHLRVTRVALFEAREEPHTSQGDPVPST